LAKLYFYKLTDDDGGAPCVQGDLLSLAICKPQIRHTAVNGDVILGFAANSLSADNRLIYIARVAANVPHGLYYKSGAHASRNDCIYEWREGRFRRREGALYHERPENLTHDLGSPPTYPKAQVLLSRDFRYFGRKGDADYKVRYPLVKDAVERLGRGHRNHHDEPLMQQLRDLMREVWTTYPAMVIGKPTSAPSPDTCHSSGSCGVLERESRKK
jgi:hypothetical protein